MTLVACAASRGRTDIPKSGPRASRLVAPHTLARLPPRLQELGRLSAPGRSLHWSVAVFKQPGGGLFFFKPSRRRTGIQREGFPCAPNGQQGDARVQPPKARCRRHRHASKTHKTRSRSKTSKCGVRIRSLSLRSPKPGDCCWRQKTLLDAHKTVEARSRIERLQALDEATKRLASEACKLD